MSAPSFAIPAAPSVGHVAAPKRGAATPDADFAAILDDAAPVETPAKAPAPANAKSDDAPAEDTPPEASADAAPLTDTTVAILPAPAAVPVAPAITIETAPTTEAAPPSLPVNALVPPPLDTAAVPAAASNAEPAAPAPAAVSAEAPAADSKTTANPTTAPVDFPDLAALQPEQTKVSTAPSAPAPAPAPARTPTSVSVAPSAAPVAPPVVRPAKPIVEADAAASAETPDEVPAVPAAEAAAAPDAPVVPTEAPRTRDAIERALTARVAPSADGAATADPKASAPSDSPQAPAPATSPTAPTASRPAAVAEPVAAQLLTDADAPITTAAASAPAAEARPAEAAASLALSTISHATIETTAHIAAQIVRKLEGRSTRFEMALTPEGLGNVDVSLDIDADGKLIAKMAFDNPLAATELRGRVDELRRQLQDSGFTVADDALSFAERDASAGQQGGSAFDRQPDPRNARAFGAASRLHADADRMVTPAAWIPLTLTPDRVDMKV